MTTLETVMSQWELRCYCKLVIQKNPYSGMVLTSPWPFTHILLPPFNKYLLSPYSVPATMSEVRDTSLRKTNQGRSIEWSLPLR